MSLRAICSSLASLIVCAAGSGSLQGQPVEVDGAFQVRYAANLQTGGEAYVDVINDGANGAPRNGPFFGNAAGIGNLCINAYVLDPTEELLSCCSCTVTPNQTVSWQVKSQILSNSLTGVQPNSVTIKLIGSNPGAAATVGGTDCSNSAATLGATVTNTFSGVTDTALAIGGYIAFGSTLHPQGTQYVTTETHFLPVTLTVQELRSLTERCAQTIGNGSNFGQCAGCSVLAIGAQKQ